MTRDLDIADSRAPLVQVLKGTASERRVPFMPTHCLSATARAPGEFEALKPCLRFTWTCSRGRRVSTPAGGPATTGGDADVLAVAATLQDLAVLLRRAAAAGPSRRPHV